MNLVTVNDHLKVKGQQDLELESLIFRGDKRLLHLTVAASTN